MKILILGGDVAALVAAHATAVAKGGPKPAILAPAYNGDPLLIAPMLNDVVPAVLPSLKTIGVPVREATLTGTGSADNWADKVGRPDKMTEYFPVAPKEKVLVHTGADIFHVLINSRMRQDIAAWDLKRVSIEELVEIVEPELVINTLPRQIFCTKPDDHGFPRRDLWVSTQIGPHLKDDEIVLNAEDAPAWYSSSKFDDRQVTKWLQPTPFENISHTSMPVSTNCDCAPVGMVHVGAEAVCDPTLTLVDVYSDTVAAVMKAMAG